MPKEKSLDPDDWEVFRKHAHAALDQAITHMQTRGQAPVWQPTPPDIRASLTGPLPMLPVDIDALNRRITSDFLPYNVGNTHGRFFGWVHGAGTPSGIMPEMFAAAMNANLGGRDHVANLVEKQVISWCRKIFDFPAGAGGLVVSGTSIATLIALKTARDVAIEKGGSGELVGYTSTQAHACIADSFDILGLGKGALRPIAVDRDFRMVPAALQVAIAQDLAQGKQPFALIGSAGTVNVGAIDPLDGLADIAAKNDLWFHVDGAFGSLAILSAAHKARLSGIERADSLAFDFHKWLHVNYDAGFILMRDAELQRRAFSDRAEYLQGSTTGLAAGNPWFCEYGPELSRGFRALKVWYQMQAVGLTRLGEKIGENCDQAAYLAGLVTDHTDLTLLSYAGLNITCFRYQPKGVSETGLDQLNEDIVIGLQMSGLAAPSTTRINGQLAIRVNITNHRTKRRDLEALIEDVCRIGRGQGTIG